MDPEVLEALSVLGVGPDDDHNTIRRAYLDLVQVWHPDRFAHDPRLMLKAEEMTKRINLAYDILRGTTWRTSEPVAESDPAENVDGSTAAPPPAQEPPFASKHRAGRSQTEREERANRAFNSSYGCLLWLAIAASFNGLRNCNNQAAISPTSSSSFVARPEDTDQHLPNPNRVTITLRRTGVEIPFNFDHEPSMIDIEQADKQAIEAEDWFISTLPAIMRLAILTRSAIGHKSALYPTSQNLT